MNESFRKASRSDWYPKPDNRPVSNDDLKVGALQRIADATEKMAQSHASIIDARDRYKRWYEEKVAENQRLARRIHALRGTITRMKRAKDGAR
jgi:hypothetical protein